MIQAAKWIGGLVAAGALLLLISVFVADRRLAPPFEEAVLDPIELPIGDPLLDAMMLFSSDRSGNSEIYMQAVEGGPPVQLTNDPDTDSWRPRLSPDRSTILFYRTPAGVGDTDYSQSSLWMMAAQGDSLIEVLPPLSHGWTRHGGAEWSPTGNELVMQGERPTGYQIWVTSLDGRAVRALVSHAGDNVDPSWDPEGARVLYAACPESPCDPTQREVFAIQTAGGERVQLTNDDIHDAQPRFSPSGSQIVVRSEMIEADIDGEGAVWDVRVFPTNRSTPPRRLIDDDSVSSSPVWLDEQTVLLHRFEQLDGGADILRVQVSTGASSPLVEGEANDRYPAP